MSTIVYEKVEKVENVENDENDEINENDENDEIIDGTEAADIVYIDCLGNAKTEEELEQRSKYRSEACQVCLVILWALTFMVLSVLYMTHNPNGDKYEKGIFIASATLLWILLLPLILYILYVAVTQIYNCVRNII